MQTTLINPLNERLLGPAVAAPRLPGLKGTTIALLDISKPGGSVFLDHIEHRLKQRHGVRNVIRVMKPTFAKPATADVFDKIRGVDAVIEALAD